MTNYKKLKLFAEMNKEAIALRSINRRFPLPYPRIKKESHDNIAWLIAKEGHMLCIDGVWIFGDKKKAESKASLLDALVLPILNISDVNEDF